MTDVTLKLLLLGEDRSAGKALKQVSRDSETAAKHAGHLHGALKMAAGAFAGGFAYEGIQKGVEFLKDSVKAAMEDQHAQAVLAQQLKTQAHATGEQTKATEEWLTSQSLATGHLKTELIPEFTKLVTATHSTTKAQSLLKLAMDVSAGTGKSLSTITDGLVRAQYGQVGGLSRLGIATKDASGKTLSFTVLQKKLAQQFKGDTAKAAQSAGGQMMRLNAMWEEAKVQVGNALLPILIHLGKWFLGVGVPALEKFGGWLQKNQGWLKVLAVGIGAVIVAVKAWRIAQAILDAELMANPIGLVVAAIAALAAVLIYAYKHSTTFRNIVNAAFHIVAEAARVMWHLVLEPIFKLWALEFRIVWDAAKKLASIIKGVWSVISTAFRIGVRFVVGVFLGLVGAILNGAAKAFGWVPKLGDKLRTAADHFNRFKDRVNRSLANIHDQKVTVSIGTDTQALTQASTNILRGRLQKHGPKLAAGGHVRGPGTGTSDSILARLSNGEFVVNARATSRHRALLEHINRGYAAGGFVVGDSGIPGGERKVARYASSTNRFVKWFAHQLHTKLDNPFAAAIGVAGQALSALTGGLGGAGGGVMRWLPDILAVLRMFGLSKRWASVGLHRMMVESGGNPTIVNKWDSNWQRGTPSVGLMQVIGPTFRAYAGPYRNTGPFLYGTSVNPLANIYAAVNYALHNYGVPFVSGTQGYYRGGRPRVGRAALVGEFGPELYVPDAPGRVATASSVRGAGGHLGTVTLELTMDGKVIQRKLLALKRNNGGLSLGLT